jgi:hypothetical protein
VDRDGVQEYLSVPLGIWEWILLEGFDGCELCGNDIDANGCADWIFGAEYGRELEDGVWHGEQYSDSDDAGKLLPGRCAGE